MMSCAGGSGALPRPKFSALACDFAHSFRFVLVHGAGERSASIGSDGMIDHTHAPDLKSWVESANLPEAEFPIQNLPYASFRRTGDERVHLGVAIGDQVLDVTEAFGIGSMSDVMEMPSASRVQLRQRISGFLAKHTPGSETFLCPMSNVELLLPCRIGDYTDFYASIHHATNVGRMFRPDNPLLPNYKWMPIAYHGRSSSIVVSGTAIRRPVGTDRRKCRWAAGLCAEQAARLRARGRRASRARQRDG